MATPDYEKLGAFYLGRIQDPVAGEPTDELLLYDSKDLTTHAVCVGMTGSGKTGLGVTLLEEAALDGIPVIAIDPKGDLGNLLLTFPKLRPEDFRPWIDENDAARHGRTPDEQARETANLWRRGLAEWGQKPARIGRFRNAVETAVYTPGSEAGIPIAALRSLAAPPRAVAEDADALRERVLSAASGLLGLLGIAADPIRSREHILLSTLLHRAWQGGRDLDLPTLIRQIQSPPIERVGVLDLDSFFPAKERSALAMTLNNLIAAPAFAAWTRGEPLEIGKLLHTESGRPRLSVLSIAHLGDAERMFFVTLLLNELVTWMRAQPGSRTLRALLYMDEVFGYFPPTANPPSKTPMLTLLKQARAYGLGVVLATQNPVDLDYKGLSNAGTWFLGRLQTERDKARVLEGLEGASASTGAHFDRARLEKTLAGLESRVFLMNNVHEDGPVLFHSRWALSYLAGPMTREQLRRVAGQPAASQKAAPTKRPAPVRRAQPPAAARARAPQAEAEAQRPMLPTGVEEGFLPVLEAPAADETLLYRPALLGLATLHYARSAAGVDEWETVALYAPLGEKAGSRSAPWTRVVELGRAAPELEPGPEAHARFAALPPAASRKPSFTRWKKMLASHLYRTRPMRLWRFAKPRLYSLPNESEGDFRARVRDALREARDLKVEKLRRRYAPKLARVQEQIGRADQRVEVEKEQYGQRKTQTWISIGATVVGAVFGRKLGSVGNVGRAATAARSASRTGREKADIARAEERAAALRAKLADLEAELADDLAVLESPIAPEHLELAELKVAPRKTDLDIESLTLTWVPFRITRHGVAEPAHVPLPLEGRSPSHV